MKVLIRFFLIFSVSFAFALQLKKEDVRETFQEMLTFHVEHGEMSPLLMGRTLKIYLEQFDPAKMYLLDPEVKEIFQISKQKLEEAIEHYKADDLSPFIEINQIIQKSIVRARIWRQEIQKGLILSSADLKPSRGETHLSFAHEEGQLRNRIYKQLCRILMEEKQLNQMEPWSPADREKIFNLWEKRFQQSEEAYLSQAKRYEHNIALHSLQALARSLDAHTAYFSPEEAAEMRSSLEKQFEGIGVVIREGIDGITIFNLVKGGPAARSERVFIGDRIIEVNGRSVAEMTYREVLEAMKGNGKNELRLKLCKKNETKAREVTLVREKIKMDDERLQFRSCPYGDGHIGVLTLPSFYEGGHQSSAEGDMREAIKKLKKQGSLKGLVLDMRENAGGFLSQAVKVAGLFISKGVIVISKYSRGEIKYLRNLDGRLYFDGPLIVLTSKASASAAEIVAQALQDYGAALIVGDEHTYGKGTIQYQTITDKSAKAFYKVTVGRYYTVSGRSTQIEGVKADIVVPTIFSSYKMGERFLEYPLPSDQVAAAYIDPLTDIDYPSRTWFQKNYLPELHKPQERWQKILPQLVKNSESRLKQNKDFVLFVKSLEQQQGHSPRSFQREVNPQWGQEDLQMDEALNIMKDMISLSSPNISS